MKWPALVLISVVALWIVLAIVSTAECYTCVGICGDQSQCPDPNCVCAFPPGQVIGRCVGGTP